MLQVSTHPVCTMIAPSIANHARRAPRCSPIEKLFLVPKDTPSLRRALALAQVVQPISRHPQAPEGTFEMLRSRGAALGHALCATDGMLERSTGTSGFVLMKIHAPDVQYCVGPDAILYLRAREL